MSGDVDSHSDCSFAKGIGHGQEARDTRLSFLFVEIAPGDQSLDRDQRKAQDGG